MMNRPRKPPPEAQPITRELRAALADDARPIYALAKAAGLDEASLRRFAARERSLSLDSADRLADTLGLSVVRKRARKPAKSVLHDPISDS